MRIACETSFIGDFRLKPPGFLVNSCARVSDGSSRKNQTGQNIVINWNDQDMPKKLREEPDIEGALNYAREMIAAWQNLEWPFQFARFGPAGVKAWNSLRLELKKDCVMLPERSADELVAQGKRDPDVYDLACFVCEARIAAGKSLPKPLDEFWKAVQSGNLKSKRGRGRPAKANAPRDVMIVQVLCDIEERYGLFRTENEARDSEREAPPSASSILQEALQQHGVYVTLDAIRKVASGIDQEPHDAATPKNVHKGILRDETYFAANTSLLDTLDEDDLI
jgi:hypothetical protein